MSVKIYREEIIRIDGREEFQIETRGELHLLPPTVHSVFCHFGVFERTPHSTLLYTLGAEDLDIYACDSHYMDDLAALRKGNFEIVDRLAA